MDCLLKKIYLKAKTKIFFFQYNFIGFSGVSETFENEILSSNKDFKIKDIEVK